MTAGGPALPRAGAVRTAAATAMCLVFLTSCGGDDVEPGPSESALAPPTSEAPRAERSDSGKRKRDRPKPLPTRPVRGDGHICARLDPAAVGAVLGTQVDRGRVKDDACVFADVLDPTTRFVGVAQVTLEEAGGADGVAGSLSALVQGEPQAVPRLGDQAYLAVGPTAAGATAAVGLVVVGGDVFSVGVPVGRGGDDAARKQVTRLLELVTDTV